MYETNTKIKLCFRKCDRTDRKEEEPHCGTGLFACDYSSDASPQS